MAPSKFGLRKARSREHSDADYAVPSTSYEPMDKPPSPVPSTSRAGLIESFEDFSMLPLHDESDEEFIPENPTRSYRLGIVNRRTEKINNKRKYKRLKYQKTDSETTVQEDLDEIKRFDYAKMDYDDGASTSYDANSLQFDDDTVSIESQSGYCAALKKSKKRANRQLSDTDMWQASNLEVMQNLLDKTGTLDEQIKWEAIANARGLCTLTDSCSCSDCLSEKYLAGVTDGDGGLGTAPLFGVYNAGCNLQ